MCGQIHDSGEDLPVATVYAAEPVWMMWPEKKPSVGIFLFERIRVLTLAKMMIKSNSTKQVPDFNFLGYHFGKNWNYGLQNKLHYLIDLKKRQS